MKVRLTGWLFLLVVMAVPAWAQNPPIVQVVPGSEISTSVTINVATTGSGHVFVALVCGQFGAGPQPPTDNAPGGSSSYTAISGSYETGPVGAPLYFCQYYIANPGKPGATQVTVNSIGTDEVQVWFYELAGLAASPVDQAGGAAGSATTSSIAGPSLTTTGANELVLEVAVIFDGILGVNAPWTQDGAITQGGNMNAAHLITSSIGTYSADFSVPADGRGYWSSGISLKLATPISSPIVQRSGWNTSCGSSSSCTTTITASNAGDLIAVFVSLAGSNSSALGTVSVTDSANQSYSEAGSPLYQTAAKANNTAETWYLPNTASGITNVTVSRTTGTGIYMDVVEIKAATSNVLDGQAGAVSTSPGIIFNSGNITTTNANDILLGFSTNDAIEGLNGTGAPTPGTGYTAIDEYGGYGDAYQAVSSKGTYSAGYTTTYQSNVCYACAGGGGQQSVDWTDQVVAFNATPASGVGIQINPTTASLSATQQKQFAAAVTGSVNTGVTWTLNPAVGTLDQTGLYTAPNSIASLQVVTVTATADADITQQANATVTLNPPAGSFMPIRVNSGGPAYTDSLGQAWSADTDYTGGSLNATSATISNTNDPTLYQTERYGGFSYNLTVPNGSYAVTLKFAEIYWSKAGQRIFNVLINGTTVLSNFDIVAQAGGPNIALDKTFTVTTTTGTITVQFVTGTADFPKVSAIQVAPYSSSGVGITINPTTMSLSASQQQQFTATVTGSANTAVTWTVYPPVGTVSQTGLYAAPSSITAVQMVTVTATAAADTTKQASATVTLGPPPGGFIPIRVNSGGSAYTDSLGQAWSADTGYTGGSLNATSATITNTNNPTLYQSERYGDFSYTFAAPNGTYAVTLKFAEIYWTKAGQRIFNVLINGTQVLTNFDIVAAAGGPNIAVDETFTVSDTTGTITIQFVTGTADLPKISAIQIVSYSSSGSGVGITINPTTAILNASQQQQFTATVTGSANTGVSWTLNPPVGTLDQTGLYTAPNIISSVQAVTVTATAEADTTQLASATVTLNPPAGSFAPIRVNSGGAAYTDSLGEAWSADTGYTGGSSYTTGSTITNTKDPTLYQSEHYGSFNYSFTAPVGSYAVTLKFAEIYWTKAGQRIFNVLINGTQVLTNFDIVAQAGGPNIALDKTFTVSDTTGNITIQFVTGTADLPKVSAVQIVSYSSSGVGITINPTTMSLSGSQQQQFTATVTGSANTAVTWTLNPAVGTVSSTGLYIAPSSITTVQMVTVTATAVADTTQQASATVTLLPPAGSFVPIRVNSGGSAYTDSLGNLWSADTDFTGGDIYTDSVSISNTPDPTLYQSERHDDSFSYSFAVPAGSYSVTLKFAELYWTSAGQRVFDVAINGTPVLTNFDIVAQAGGPDKALDKTFTVNASTGAIIIQFSVGTADQPKISAIQITH